MKMTVKKQLIISLLLVGIIPFVVISIISFNKSDEAMMKKSYDTLTSVRDSKLNQIENFFGKIVGDITIMSKNAEVTDLTTDLRNLHDQLKVKGTDPYPVSNEGVKRETAKYEEFFQDYMKEYGYYDIFVVCAKHGHVMYSAAKESDYGANVGSGSLRDSGLGEVWKKVNALKRVVFVDMRPYAPSNQEPAMFLGIPIYDNGKMVSVLVFQISDKAINDIMQFREGYGKTQEDYLVGQDELMRSDSFLDPTGHSLKASFANNTKVHTIASKNALQGQSNTELIIDYNGNPVLSAYKSFKIGEDLTWAIISEIDDAEVDEPVQLLLQDMLIIGVIFLVVIVVIAILLANYVSKPIINAVSTIATGSEQVVAASDQIASSATMLSESASDQAASVEEVSATIEETSTTVEQNSNNAREADILSSDASSSAQEGYECVKDLLLAMEEITGSSKEIANIIKTIDEIAFQTNLLALNAAVEAARAGEHGLGFAVVADEVRNLAGRSSTAAKETATIIENSLAQVQKGNSIATDTNKAFEEILDKVKKSGNLVGEIAMASKEQTEGMSQINKAMNQIDQVTQTVASTSEESAAAAEELNAQAVTMSDTVKELGALVGYTAGMEVSNVQTKQRKKVSKAKPVARAKNKSPEDIMPLSENDTLEF
ncbi:MAG: methyl-accepting chemotaxis protein [Arcobacteraceae bacterium]|nr:methyl-accepting chemotaxis protein [Arcobacteraceae bacterium]